jgi:hypothetical protein
MSEPRFIEARPIEGSVRHAIVNRPDEWRRTGPRIIITFNRALCGVGAGGMRVETDAQADPVAFQGTETECSTCRRRVKAIEARS